MKQKIKTFQIIHMAITLGVVLAYISIGNVFSTDRIVLPKIDSSSIAFVFLPFLAIGLSTFLFKNIINKIDPKLSLEEKTGQYQTASIIRWAILEATAFVLLVVKPGFIIFGIGIIIWLATLRPSENRIKADLNHQGK